LILSACVLKYKRPGRYRFAIAARVLQQCKSGCRIRTDLLRGVLGFFAGDWKKA